MKLSKPIYILISLVFFCSMSGCSSLGHATGGLFSGMGSIIGGSLKLIGSALDLAGKLPVPPGVF